ncbi:MAG: bifunctional 3-deoxy-7-phosphoheptulonate synthase/chorismate mutase type II [Bacteroidia bacterium]|nr:bifunctional 3-deoxy-7-phosphoheptulonate synthase/chorismate mutase type II [Bacteroidia bacterium]
MKFSPLSSWLTSHGSQALLISGPCGAESREQVLQTAQGLSQLNRVDLFRAGVWKPRTRPGTFEGKGEEALKWLQEVKTQFGFKTTVEVATAAHVELALKYGVDVLWIGARSTANPFSVQEIADALKGKDVPVMVKNPVQADLQLWIGAIERVYNAGITKLAAIHRGFHFYGKSQYRNEPVWQIPIELRTLFPELSLFCDPSHICGNKEGIPSVAQKALDLGMDGLMIESHYQPENALSDKEQQFTPQALGEVLAHLVQREQLHRGDKRVDRLIELRKIIDQIDEDILNSVQRRNRIIEQIGLYKKEHNISIFQLERWQEILRTRAGWAEHLGLSLQHVEKLCQLLHEESIRLQNALMNK